MIICIVFMANTQLAKQRWEVLVVYTMTILFLKYFWVLLIPFTRLRLIAMRGSTRL
jgi:hypothetical protein